MTDPDVHGPVDFVLLEFPRAKPDGRVAEALIDLVERGIVRVYDLLVVRKETDGTFSGVDLTEASPDDTVGFVAFAGARSGLLGDDDLRKAADAMEPGTVAALIVYENAWAIPFVAAARDAGGQLIASARIPAEDIMNALEAIETTP
jgi:dihydroorotase-like cyclic amidohydrolase